MRMRAAVLSASLAALLLCAACVPRLVAPSFTLTSVTVNGGGLRSERVQLGVHVDNPNDRLIHVQSLEVHLTLGGHAFADGTSEQAFTVPAQGGSDFAMDVTADLGNALAALAASFADGTIPYRLEGRVHLQRGLVRNLHFTHDGRVHVGAHLRVD